MHVAHGLDLAVLLSKPVTRDDPVGRCSLFVISTQLESRGVFLHALQCVAAAGAARCLTHDKISAVLLASIETENVGHSCVIITYPVAHIALSMHARTSSHSLCLDAIVQDV